MDINFELYKIFYEVANCGNITKASQKLNLTQPAISKSIKNLEDQLGGTLFVRSKKGVVLTEEGEAFYRNIKNAMEYISNAENEFTNLVNLEQGTIKIGISTTLTKEFLLPYLKKFHELYPKIDIQINTNITSELIPKLKNGLIDIVIFNNSNRIFSNDLDIIKCEKVNDCFIVNNKYSELINKEISIKDLNNYPLLLQPKGSNSRDFIDSFASKYNTVLKPIMELASYTLVVEFAKIGLGVGVARVGSSV